MTVDMILLTLLLNSVENMVLLNVDGFWRDLVFTISATRPDRGYGGGQTRKWETKTAVERQYHPIDWSHLREPKTRQEKMEIHDMHRHRHAMWLK